MFKGSKVHTLRRIEVLLGSVGLGCALICVLTGVRTVQARQAAAAIESRRTQPPMHAESGEPTSLRETPAASSDVMGHMEIPQLGLTVPILSDYDPESLRHGVGHIRGTALPGGLGTVGLAGHRDTFLRPLRRIAPGMEIRLADANGVFAYRVDRTEIVTPEQVEVLDIVARPELTVVTCFPFNFVGAAPKRFIVHAHLLSLLPEDAPTK